MNVNCTSIYCLFHKTNIILPIYIYILVSSVQLCHSVPFVIIYISFKIYLNFFKIDVKTALPSIMTAYDYC